MGRARQNISAATVVAFGSRSRHADSTRVDPHRDAVWFKHGKSLTEATKLLRRIDDLAGREADKLLRIMRRVGAGLGLDGHWRLLGSEAGDVKLAYCSWLADQLGGLEHSRWHILEDSFTGGLIDGLPEQRYLGRRIHELADAVALLPQPTLVGGNAAAV